MGITKQRHRGSRSVRTDDAQPLSPACLTTPPPPRWNLQTPAAVRGAGATAASRIWSNLSWIVSRGDGRPLIHAKKASRLAGGGRPNRCRYHAGYETRFIPWGALEHRPQPCQTIRPRQRPASETLHHCGRSAEGARVWQRPREGAGRLAMLCGRCKGGGPNGLGADERKLAAIVAADVAGYSRGRRPTKRARSRGSKAIARR